MVTCLTVKALEVSKPRDWMLWYSYHSEIWQASRQHCCRRAWRLEKSKPESCGFETSRDLTSVWLSPPPFPLHRAAAFVPPLSDHTIEQDAEWSPTPRKFCFYVTPAARPLCVPWTTKTAVVVQQVGKRMQCGARTIAVDQRLPWSSNGGTVVATVIAQWTLLVGKRRHSGGTSKAEASLKLTHNVHNSRHVFTGRPMANHCASILRPRRCVCLPSAPLSDLWATNLLGDLCATVLNMLKISRRPWRPWRGLNVLCTTFERPRQPFGFLSAFSGDLASFMVAQGTHKGRSPWIKGVLLKHNVYNSTHFLGAANGWPYASILRPRRWAFLLPPLSDPWTTTSSATFVRLFWTW